MKFGWKTYSVAMSAIVIVLFMANLLVGSVRIPALDVIAVLCGDDNVREAWRYIVMESRLPQTITATLSGAALSVSGLLLQTAFRNPLAGPSIFGINGGAGLGVALVMLAMGGSMGIGSYSISGQLAILFAAFIGAMAVTGLIFFFSLIVRHSVLLLIIGIMVGYVSSSAISLLNFFATEEGVRSYMLWGMGDFGAVSMRQLPLFLIVTVIGLCASVLLIKPLNALLLGEQYAENLGVDTRRVRNLLLIITGLLTAVTTAFCGPVAFLGLAVPHIARMLLSTDNHRQLLPSVIITGSAVALLCNAMCFLPGERGIIPLNAITPLVGAPVVIYVIMKKK